jgi:VWFA-related protein
MCGVAACVLVAAGGNAQSQQQQQPPPSQAPESQVTIRVELVRMVFTVMNRRQKFITDLNKENFKVFENRLPQDITFFSRETDLPLRVGILLDTSNSIRDRLKFEQEAATDFVYNVIRRKKDLAFLMTFDSESGLIEGFTDDHERLKLAIQRQRAGGGTALYRAIDYACREQMTNSPLPAGQTPEVRKLLVVLSDGVDTDPPGPSSRQAIEACQRSETSIYSISTSTESLAISGDKPQKIHKTDGDKNLEAMADQTGGRAFFPYRTDDLAQSFMDIGDELRSQYWLAYEPTNKTADGKFREVNIEVDRKGLIIRSRKGYYATPTRAAAQIR